MSPNAKPDTSTGIARRGFDGADGSRGKFVFGVTKDSGQLKQCPKESSGHVGVVENAGQPRQYVHTLIRLAKEHFERGRHGDIPVTSG